MKQKVKVNGNNGNENQVKKRLSDIQEMTRSSFESILIDDSVVKRSLKSRFRPQFRSIGHRIQVQSLCLMIYNFCRSSYFNSYIRR